MMKIAVPVAGDRLTPHFGHCEKFAILTIDGDERYRIEYLVPPAHQPGVYPRFLAEKGVNIIIAGGMGPRAQEIFAQNNIRVITGIEQGDPRGLAEKFLRGELIPGDNLCDH
jgi:predicted Fe-Mo cluster-binding NifX family protein